MQWTLSYRTSHSGLKSAWFAIMRTCLIIVLCCEKWVSQSFRVHCQWILTLHHCKSQHYCSLTRLNLYCNDCSYSTNQFNSGWPGTSDEDICQFLWLYHYLLFSIYSTWQLHDFPTTVRLLWFCQKHFRSSDAIQINPELSPPITAPIQPSVHTAQTFNYS